MNAAYLAASGHSANSVLLLLLAVGAAFGFLLLASLLVNLWQERHSGGLEPADAGRYAMRATLVVLLALAVLL